MNPPALPLGLLAVALFTPLAHATDADAQKPPDKAVAELEMSFITASGSGTDLRDAPASVSVITREEIERQPVHDLNALLRRLPGVTGGFGPVGEQSKIKLRGLDDKYTLILVDGKRMGSSADTHYRRDLGRQDLNWISPNMIERIEVVRGPMSSLYGSDAMGGVINIITRKVSRTWSGSLEANATVPQNSDRGQTQQTSVNLSGPLSESIGLRLGGNVTRRASDEVRPRLDALGEPLPNDGAGGAKDRSANALLDWRVNQDHSVSFEVSQGVEQAWASDMPESQISAFGAGQLTRESYSTSYNGDLGFATARVDAYLNRFKNKISAEKADSEEKIVEGSLTMPLEWQFNQRLTVGSQWMRESLTNTRTLGTVPVDYQGQPVAGSSYQRTTWAAFIENEIFLLDNLSLTLGNRFDHNDTYGNHHSPRAYVVYHPHPDWTLRGGISKGFRAPNLKEGSAGAATFSKGRGCTSLQPLGYVTGGCWMAGNPNLRPETSISKEMGVAYDFDDWQAGLTYFHTDFRNKIEYAPKGFHEGRWWTVLENAEKARTRGWEGSFSVPVIADRVTWRSNATYLLESRNLSTGKDLISAPKLSLYSALDWQINQRFNAELAAQHVGKQRGVATDFIKSYTTYDLAGVWTASDWLTVKAGIQNLLDEDARDGATRFYVPGRAYFVGATTQF